MDFSERLKHFNTAHPWEQMATGAGVFRYRLSGAPGRPAVLCLNEFGIHELWMDYVLALEKDYQVLTVAYPEAIQTSAVFCGALSELLNQLGLREIALMGAGDGGLLAQIYAAAHPDQVKALILMATATADCGRLSELRRRGRTYFPILRRKINLMNPKKLITLAEQALRDETAAEKVQIEALLWDVAAAGDYRTRLTQTARLAQDMLTMRPGVIKAELAGLEGSVLLIFPDQDIFDRADQKKLEALWDCPEVRCVRGGHLSVAVRPQEYLRWIKVFLKGNDTGDF